MNERIRELALKSGIAYLSEHTAYFQANDGLTVLPSVDGLEKFAELIVRECVRHFNEDYQRDFDNLWREDLSKSIKQHFGVEE